MINNKFNREILKKFIDPKIVDEFIKDPKKISIGGVKRNHTILFSDISQFSSLCEILEPQELFYFLNDYLSIMFAIISKNNGTVLDMDFDSITVIFGTPNYLENHFELACRTSIEMKNENIAHIISKYTNITKNHFFTRIGINQGEMIVGYHGCLSRLKYSAFGNSVSLGSRFLRYCLKYGTQIMTSGESLYSLSDKLIYRPLDYIRIVGLNTPIRLCEIIDFRNNAKKETIEIINLFNNAGELFDNRNWKEANKLYKIVLESRPNDKVVKFYIDRCNEYQNNPPSEHWDGVYNM